MLKYLQIICLISAPTVRAQFGYDFQMAPDVAFDDHNDRFDISDMTQDRQVPYDDDDEGDSRRSAVKAMRRIDLLGDYDDDIIKIGKNRRRADVKSYLPFLSRYYRRNLDSQNSNPHDSINIIESLSKFKNVIEGKGDKSRVQTLLNSAAIDSSLSPGLLKKYENKKNAEGKKVKERELQLSIAMPLKFKLQETATGTLITGIKIL